MGSVEAATPPCGLQPRRFAAGRGIGIDQCGASIRSAGIDADAACQENKAKRAVRQGRHLVACPATGIILVDTVDRPSDISLAAAADNDLEEGRWLETVVRLHNDGAAIIDDILKAEVARPHSA